MSKENPTKKLIRSKSGLKIVAVDENHKSPFLLSEPQWVPDEVAPVCTRCRTKFKFTTRRHHCRRCGQVYCGTCCDQKLELPRMCFIDPVRVCKNCAPVSLQEIKFFDEQIKTLVNGATFVLEDSKTILSSNDVLQCKLSPDHRQLVFDGVKLAPLDVGTMKSLRVKKDPANENLNEDDELGVKSVEMEFCIGNSEEKQMIRLTTTPELEHRKTGSQWISAMNQAFKMLEEYQAEG